MVKIQNSDSEDSLSGSESDISSDEEAKDKQIVVSPKKEEKITTTTAVIPKSPCLPNKHVKSTDLFCTKCRTAICAKCLAFHPGHEVVDYEELLENILKNSKKFSDDLKAVVEERIGEKDINYQLFQDSVQKHYDEQTLLISDHFKKLHDQLHYREVELKRELKSYHDENEETLATFLSKVENEIQQSKEFITEFEQFKPTQDDDEKNMKLVTDYYEALASTGKTLDNNLYRIYSFVDSTTDTTINSLLKIQQKRSVPLQYKGSTNKTSSEANCVIYTYGKDGVEKYNIVTGDVKLILKAGAPNSPPFMSFFWHYTVIDQIIYMFDRDKAWVLDTTADKPAWREIKFGCNTSSSCSAVYDGQDLIYIFGGYCLSNKDDIKSIFTFNIRTEEFKEVGNKLINSSYLSMTYDNGLVYLIGGYNTTNSWLNRLDIFDCKTGKVEHLCKVTDTNVLINSGIWVPSKELYYCFTWTAGWYSINKQGICTRLAKPGCSPNYTKSFFDGNNTIYLIVERDRNIYIYDIEKDTFKVQPSLFENEIFSSNFVGCSNE
ncbi:hypothetical protein DLAC_00027 [Tieghemostelium lacteum]|uniref:B box-type domain-containing protein n=1 Tax=Tieghemostelium lacteum TaxID=361077 RepID=A0A152A8Y4_TIELA|nr:hypothetical protein DLAC_00027 [Tieghemostelium lacteum]|eukprot:KYR02585.1 hypothetical protein DLAC_00027 [Tieghemostelium lacteum]